MDRLFLDANILFSAAYNLHGAVLRLWKLPGVELWSSHYAVGEARTNLTQLDQRERLNELTKALSFCDVIQKELPPGISLPEKDIPIMVSAIEARATHLLTGDLRHFGRFFGKRIGGVLIAPPAAYLNSRRVE